MTDYAEMARAEFAKQNTREDLSLYMQYTGEALDRDFHLMLTDKNQQLQVMFTISHVDYRRDVGPQVAQGIASMLDAFTEAELVESS